MVGQKIYIIRKGSWHQLGEGNNIDNQKEGSKEGCGEIEKQKHETIKD